MAGSPSIARMSWAQAKLVHCSSTAASMSSKPSVAALCVTDPASISLVFFGQDEAVVAKHGVTSRRRIVPGGIMLCGPEPIRWLRRSGSGAGEFIEIAAHACFRRELADQLRVPEHVDLDDIHGWSDPIIWAIAARSRSAALRTIALSDLEGDVLLRRLYGRVLAVRFGRRGSARGDGGLDNGRLKRLLEFIAAHLEEPLTIARLAEVAALSPFHFVRAFRRLFGLTPHRYVQARRRARNLLASGMQGRTIARRIGYESRSHFRAAYRAHFGATHEHDGRLGRHHEDPS